MTAFSAFAGICGRGVGDQYILLAGMGQHQHGTLASGIGLGFYRMMIHKAFALIEAGGHGTAAGAGQQPDIDQHPAVLQLTEHAFRGVIGNVTANLPRGTMIVAVERVGTIRA